MKRKGRKRKKTYRHQGLLEFGILALILLIGARLVQTLDQERSGEPAQIISGGTFTFVEEFDDDQLQDINYTTADWNTDESALLIPDDTQQAQALSLTVDAVSDTIVTATLSVEQDPKSGSTSFYLSNDNGLTYSAVAPGVPLTFQTAGSKLRWKAELSRLNEEAASPVIDMITIVYSTKPQNQVVHINGADPVHLAIEVAHQIYPAAGSASALFISRSDEIIDAFSAIPLASIQKAAILFTPSGQLDPDTLAEAKRVLGTREKPVIILGGEAAINSSIVDTLRAEGFPRIDRIGGDTRYETGALIAEAISRANTSTTSHVYLTEASSLVDTFGIAPVAGKSRDGASEAILLTQRGDTELHPATSAYLAKDKKLASIEIIGGVEAVPATIEDEIKLKFPHLVVTRIAGLDRFDTNAEIITAHFQAPTSAIIVPGRPTDNRTGFYPALLGGWFAATLDVPLLLSEYDGLPSGIAQFVYSRRNTIDTGYLIGPSSEFSEKMQIQLSNLL
jgi:putative cell wall-binding protein